MTMPCLSEEACISCCVSPVLLGNLTEITILAEAEYAPERGLRPDLQYSDACVLPWFWFSATSFARHRMLHEWSRLYGPSRTRASSWERFWWPKATMFC